MIPTMMYGLETVTVTKRREDKLEVGDLKMFRFSLGVLRMEKIHQRGSLLRSLKTKLKGNNEMLWRCAEVVVDIKKTHGGNEEGHAEH